MQDRGAPRKAEEEVVEGSQILAAMSLLSTLEALIWCGSRSHLHVAGMGMRMGPIFWWG